MKLGKYYFLLISWFLFSINSFSATYYTRANTNWNTPSTWSTVACGGAASATIPGAADNVIICAGYSVTMNGNPANCLSLTISGTADWASGFIINVGLGGVVMNPGSSITGSGGPNSGTIIDAGNFTVNAGGTSTIQRGSITVSGTTNIFGAFAITSAFGNKTFQDVNIINGGSFNSNATETYTINGNVVMRNGTLTGTSIGVFNIGGTLTVAAGTSVLGAGTLTVTGTTTIIGTLNENSTTGTKTFSNVIINSGAVWNNLSAETYDVSGTLTMNGGSITGTSTGSYNITGGFTVASGTNTLGQSQLIVTGPTNINSTLNITNITGNKTFADFNISASGNWNSAVAEDFTINGNISNAGIFTSNSGIYTIAGLGKTISGSSKMSFVNLNNTGSYINNGIVEVSTSHYGAGSFSQGTTGSYFQKMLSASFTVTTFNASAIGNIVTYNYAGAQNIRIPTDGSYYHLTTAGSGIKTLIANTTLGGNVLISSGTTLSAVTFTLFVKGNFTNNGTFTAGTGTVTLNGTTLQTIGGSVITSFRNLTVSDAAGVSLAINTSVTGILNFTSGVITTGTNKVSITVTGSVTGAGTSKFVNGYLEKNVALGAGVIRTFEIGNGTTNYLPVTLNFATVSTAGNITANVSNADHSNITTSCIDELKSVNHYWTLANSGTVFTTYSAACTFIGPPTDADAGSVTGNYYMSLYNGGAWTLLTRGAVGATSNQGTGIISLGDLQVGERRTPTIPVQPSNDTVCNNTPAIFSLTVTGVGLSYQWQQNNGGGFVNIVNGGIYSGATTPTLTINPATNGMNNYLYQCVIANTCGTAIVTSNAVMLTVTPNVTASVVISPNPVGAICAGTNVTFTAVPTNGGTTPIYQWKVNGINAGSNSSSFSSSTLNNSDQVTCVLTSDAVCVIGSPATSNIVVMTVNPNLPVSVNITATSTIICPATNVTFTATPTNGGASPVYQWKLNGGNVGGNSTTYSNAALLNGDIVTCDLTSNAICPTGNPATSNAITITVNPLLPVSVSIAPSPSSTVCAGTNVTFTATPVNGGGAPSYQWKLNGVNVGSNSATYSNAGLVNGDIISCILSSSATCASGSPATSTSVTMTVNPNLPLSISIAASSTTICSGTSVTFTASPVNGGGYESYQWKLNGVNVGTDALVLTLSTLANGDNITCVLSTTAQCVTGNPATSNTITMTVNPNLPASVSIAATATTICSGTNVTFTATPTNGGAVPVYQWKLNGVNVGANSSTYLNAALVNGDIVTCVLTSNALCATGNPATSNLITMTVNPNLPVSVSISGNPAGSICSGTSVTYTAIPTNGGASPAYQWKLNGVNVGSNSSVYTNASLIDGDIISCVLTSNAVCPTGNPATSNSITQNVVTSGTWLGSVSNDWNDVSNWCGGVPLTTTNITIPSGTPFSPILSGIGNCKNITIAVGAVLDLNDQTLNVFGAFSGTGTLKGSLNSDLNFAGAGSGGTFYMDQSVSGISNNLNQLTVNRAGTSVTAGNVFNVTNNVTISSGTLIAGNNLTLVSNASGTARVGILVAGADITGNVTAQRYIPAGTDGWMFISSPVSGATLQDWDDDFITGGFPGSFYPPSPNPSIVSYNESLPGIYDDGYIAPGNITDPIVARKGYWAYIMGTPVTLDVTGPLLKSTQTFAVTYTNDVAQPASENGWNLVANPYASTIDWDGAGWTKTNINDAVYMYSPTLDQYTSYVGGIGTNGGSNLIASSQAFLVQTSGAGPVLKLTESAKDASDGLFIRASQQVSNDDLIKLDLSGNGYTDETIIHFNGAASDNFDVSYDAMKFFSFNANVPGIASLLDTTLLSVNTYPLLTGDKIIPIKVKVGISGNYTIALDAQSRLPEGSCIVLKDLLTGIETDLRSTSSVTCFINDTTVSPRFILKIGKPIQYLSSASTCNGNLNGMAVVTGNGTGPFDYIWSNSSGNVIQTHSSVSSSDTLKNISSGIYSVKISGNNGVCPTSDVTINVLNTDSLSIEATVLNASCSGNADGSIGVTSIIGGNMPYNITWSNGINGSDNLNLPVGSYSISVMDSNGCIQVQTYNVDQDSPFSADFIMSTDTVHLGNDEAVEFSTDSKFITSVIWNFGDGSPLDYSPNPSYLYSDPGTYTVTLVASDGNCTDTIIKPVVVLGGALGINELSFGDQIKIGTINNNTIDLIFNMSKITNIDIEVFNSIGQQVFQTQQVKAFKNRISFNFEDKAKGIYYIKMLADSGVIVVKKVVRY